MLQSTKSFCRPTEQQEMLLIAALGSGDHAMESWERWKAAIADLPLEQLDHDSQWLLPLLYQRVRLRVSNSPLLSRCRNVYLQNWYKNNFLLHSAIEALNPAVQAGVRLILLKGMAMSVRYYNNLGVRPCVSFDILAPDPTIFREYQHRILRDRILIPHLRLFDPDVDRHFVRNISSLQLGKTALHVLGPVEQLLHILAFGDEWDERSRLFWIADAATVIAEMPDCDWTTLLPLSRQIGSQEIVMSRFNYLQQLLRLNIQ